MPRFICMEFHGQGFELQDRILLTTGEFGRYFTGCGAEKVTFSTREDAIAAARRAPNRRLSDPISAWEI